MCTGNYSIDANNNSHVDVLSGGSFLIPSGTTITLVGTPAFASEFIFVDTGGMATVGGVTFAGTGGTGRRYFCHGNGGIFTTLEAAGTAINYNYFPGNLDGSATSGGIYD